VQVAAIDCDAATTAHALSVQAWAAWRAAGLEREEARRQVGMATAVTGGTFSSETARVDERRAGAPS
jgi:hypothetical protein